MLLSKDAVLKKLNEALVESIKKVDDRIAYLNKEIGKEKSDFWVNRYRGQIKSAQNKLKGFRSLSGIPYRPRLNKFKKPNLVFCPETGEARSYEWYILGKVINGRYVLNDYNYSQTTAGHASELRTTLNILGVDYISIEAPQGLQDLNSALDLYLKRIATKMVEIEHGAAITKNWRLKYIEIQKNNIETLKSLNTPLMAYNLDEYLSKARADREKRLEQGRLAREAKRIRDFKRAVETKDLRGIVAFHSYNKKRVKKGLPPLAA